MFAWVRFPCTSANDLLKFNMLDSPVAVLVTLRSTLAAVVFQFGDGCELLPLLDGRTDMLPQLAKLTGPPLGTR